MMIPGACCGSWCFDDFAASFRARGWEVECAELRHHAPTPDGAAPEGLAGTSLQDYAADLEAALRERGDRPVLVGHSMGGLLAQILAGRGLASGLVLLAPAAPWGVLPSSREEVAAAMGLMSLGAFWQEAIAPDYEIAAETSLNVLAPERRREVFERFVPESGQALFEAMFWMFDVNRASYVNGMRVDCPVLCVGGGEDRVVTAETVHRVAEKYRDVATDITFSEHGHMLLLEDGWEEIAASCLDWLADNDLALRKSGMVGDRA